METTEQNIGGGQSAGAQKWIIIAVLVIIALALLFVLKGKDDTEPVNRPEEESLVESDDSQAMPSESMYRNGIYSVVGEYISPGGMESIGVTLTLVNGVITDSVVIPHAERPISVTMQADFTANYKTFVVGKNIDEVSLTKVSGSSLTPVGFNDALAKIKIEAQS